MIGEYNCLFFGVPILLLSIAQGVIEHAYYPPVFSIQQTQAFFSFSHKHLSMNHSTHLILAINPALDVMRECMYPGPRELRKRAAGEQSL